MNHTNKANEFSKELDATKARNSRPVTITLTEIEIFYIVSVLQIGIVRTPKLNSLGKVVQQIAKKMHDCLDPNSLLSLQLKEGWELLEEPENASAINFPAENFPPEGFRDG